MTKLGSIYTIWRLNIQESVRVLTCTLVTPCLIYKNDPKLETCMASQWRSIGVNQWFSTPYWERLQQAIPWKLLHASTKKHSTCSFDRIYFNDICLAEEGIASGLESNCVYCNYMKHLLSFCACWQSWRLMQPCLVRGGSYYHTNPIRNNIRTLIVFLTLSLVDDQAAAATQ